MWLFVVLLEVVPVEVTSVILQSVDGTQTELQISDGEHLSPVLLNPTLCANVVLKVSWLMTGPIKSRLNLAKHYKYLIFIFME